MFHLSDDMEPSALCSKLWRSLLILSTGRLLLGYSSVPRFDPNRLQFFEYDTISVKCGGSDDDDDEDAEWRLMKRLKTDPVNATRWETSTRIFSIGVAFVSHSGEYWCESENGTRSQSVDVSVTAGPVLLDVPAAPVMEGADVTLRCRNRMTASSRAADFYKDGLLLATGYEGRLTIINASTAHEGFYKCITSEAESPESWLRVRADDDQDGPESPPSSEVARLSVLPLLVASVVVFVAVMLLLVGGFYCRRHKGICVSSVTTSATASAVEQVNTAQTVYAAVTRRPQHDGH